jgi:hypothetical protein
MTTPPLSYMGDLENYFAVHFDLAPHNVHMPDLGQLKYELIFGNTPPPSPKMPVFAVHVWFGKR